MCWCVRALVYFHPPNTFILSRAQGSAMPRAKDLVMRQGEFLARKHVKQIADLVAAFELNQRFAPHAFERLTYPGINGVLRLLLVLLSCTRLRINGFKG